MRPLRHALPFVFMCALAACGGGAAGTNGGGATVVPSAAPSPTASAASMWKPSLSDSFQWILSTALDTTAPATVYDIDDFNASSADVAKLHSLGRRVVCYIDVGSYEDYRPDASSFPASVLGNVYAGYPNERWLDVRQIGLLSPIMNARMDLCKNKGFDAVEPDNIDGYQNATGFPLTGDDQIKYNTWIAGLAHARGLSIALKNDGDQVGQLEPAFDFALVESCWAQSTCSAFAPFHADGKAVFTVEYTNATTSSVFLNTYCPLAKSSGFYALLKNVVLDAPIETCP